MPTIKRKVEMNLPELIEWAWKNEFISSVFWTSNREEGFNNKAFFDVDGNFYTSDNFNFNDTFTVEVEEPITEDTVFDKLISRYVFLSSKPSYAHSINTSIKEVIEYRKVATHIYLENEDNELQLIWTKKKGLVE